MELMTPFLKYHVIVFTSDIYLIRLEGIFSTQKLAKRGSFYNAKTKLHIYMTMTSDHVEMSNIPLSNFCVELM